MWLKTAVFLVISVVKRGSFGWLLGFLNTNKAKVLTRVITVVKKGQFWAVISVVKKRQFWVVISVVKNRQFWVVINFVKKAVLGGYYSV